MKKNILAVTNRKGGVGKTTIAVNIAAGLATNYKMECVLVDADPIGSSTLWLNNTVINRLKLRKLTLPKTPININHALQTWGATISSISQDCDIVIIDLPPIDTVIFSELIHQVSRVIIPVGLNSLEWEATFPLIERVMTTYNATNNKKGIIVPSRIHPHKILPREKIIEVLPTQWTLGPQLSLRSDYQKASELKNWIGNTAKDSLAHKEINKLVSFIAKEIN